MLEMTSESSLNYDVLNELKYFTNKWIIRNYFVFAHLAVVNLTSENKYAPQANYFIELRRFRSVFLILRWQKKEEGRHNKEVSQLRLQKCWPSFVGHLFLGLLLSVCMSGHPYKSSYRFGIEILELYKTWVQCIWRTVSGYMYCIPECL